MATEKKHTAEQVRDISVLIYRAKLDREFGAGSSDAVDEKRAKTGKGLSIRERAGAYDPLTHLYIQVLEIKP